MSATPAMDATQISVVPPAAAPESAAIVPHREDPSGSNGNCDEGDIDLERNQTKDNEDLKDMGCPVKKRLSDRICPKTRRGRQICCVCSSILGILITLVVIATVLLWPREPVWHLTNLAFNEGDLDSLIDAFTGQAESAPPMPFNATVEVYNPNFVSASAQAGHFDVFFGDYKLGSGNSEAVYVPARSSLSLPADVHVTISREVSAKIKDYVLAHKLHVPVTAVTHTHVTLPWCFNMRILVIVTCEVDAHVVELIQDPTNIITSKTCSYQYRPWQ